MAAIKKDELAQLEAKHGVGEDGLTYQQRCSRITALEAGNEWEKPTVAPKQTLSPAEALKRHPLYGKTLIISPLMAADKNRNVYYEEVVGHDIKVSEFDAGAAMYGAPEDIEKMTGSYKIISEDKKRPVLAKTTMPKIGTEITWQLGKQLVPVVRGNDGQRGYIWSFPTSITQVGDTMIQLYGLKTLITHVYPELLEKFSGKPIMSYVDGFTLVASIPLTDALIKGARRKEMLDVRAGIL
jgi:hypothetical protein